MNISSCTTLNIHEEERMASVSGETVAQEMVTKMVAKDSSEMGDSSARQLGKSHKERQE